MAGEYFNYSHYEPGVETESSNPGMLVILTGASKAGKTAVAEALISQNVATSKLVTTTTRPPRERPDKSWEMEGIDYHFVNEAEFDEMIANDEFVESAPYSGFRYGTTKVELLRLLEGNDLVSVMEMSGAASFIDQVKEELDENLAAKIIARTVVVFLGMDNRMLIRKRNIRSSDSDTRDEEDIALWRKFAGEFENIVINEHGRLSQAANEIVGIVESFRQ